MKHNHDYRFTEIQGIYDGILYKECAGCEERVVKEHLKDRYNRWQKSLPEKSRYTKPVIYQGHDFYDV